MACVSARGSLRAVDARLSEWHMAAVLDNPEMGTRRGEGAARGRVVTICHPLWRLARAGLEGQMLQSIALLPVERFRHIVLVRDGQSAAGVASDDVSTDENVTVIHAPGGPDRWWAMRLARLCRTHAVDVLHVRGLGMLLDGAVATQLCPTTRLAFSFHGVDRESGRPGRLRRKALRWAMARCAARWAVSESAAEAASALLDVDAAMFTVMPNGVRTGRFAPAADRSAVRARLGLPRERVICLCVANLKPVKGQDVLLAAAAMRPAWRDRVTFVLVGGDYMDGRLQAQAARELPGCDVHFVGEVGDVLPYYQAADVFVLPSRSEGLSNAMLEAMACGLPVVATRVGAAGEVLSSDLVQGRPRIDKSHNQTNCVSDQSATCGLLVPPEDPAGLAAAVDMLIADAALRSRLGAAARARVLEGYDAERTAARYAAACEALAAGGINGSYFDNHEESLL